MKCCDADGVCTGGADCLAGPATVAPPRTTPRSCEALGVCRQTPALPVQFAGDEPDDDYDPGTALLLFIDAAKACGINAGWSDLGNGAVQCFQHTGKKTITAQVTP